MEITIYKTVQSKMILRNENGLYAQGGSSDMVANHTLNQYVLVSIAIEHTSLWEEDRDQSKLPDLKFV